MLACKTKQLTMFGLSDQTLMNSLSSQESMVPSLLIMSFTFCSTEGPMETIGDVNGHHSPAKLLKCFGIQNQEECTLVLKILKTCV